MSLQIYDHTERQITWKESSQSEEVHLKTPTTPLPVPLVVSEWTASAAACVSVCKNVLAVSVQRAAEFHIRPFLFFIRLFTHGAESRAVGGSEWNVTRGRVEVDSNLGPIFPKIWSNFRNSLASCFLRSHLSRSQSVTGRSRRPKGLWSNIITHLPT